MMDGDTFDIPVENSPEANATLQAELDAMLDFSVDTTGDTLGDEGEASETPSVESTEAVESTASVESTETSAAVETPAAAEQPEAPADLATLTAQLAEMRQLVQSMLTAPPPIAAPATPVNPVPTQALPPTQQQPSVAQQMAQATAAPAAIPQYVASLKEMEEALQSPEAFNALLNKVHTATVEQTLRAIPDVTRSIASEEIRLQAVTQEFYRVNNDLADQSQLLSQIAQSLAYQNPNLRLEEIMNETEKRARVILNRPRKLAQPASATGTPRRPAFATGSGGGATPPPTPAKSRKQTLADELAELNSLQ